MLLVDLMRCHKHSFKHSQGFPNDPSRCKLLKELVRPAGLEPATLCLEGRCSIHLSYGRTREPAIIIAMRACSLKRERRNIRPRQSRVQDGNRRDMEDGCSTP